MGGLTFLIVFLILMALVAFAPLALRRWHVPAVVAIMLAGIAIGPNAFDLIGNLNETLGRGYSTENIHVVIDAMGLLGLIFLMALAGMEVNLRIMFAEKKAVSWLSILTFALPAAAGYAVYAVFEPADTIGKWVYASLFASHSVGIVFPVIRELKVTQTRFGVAILASTVVTDIASLILLAVCIQFKRHASTGGAQGSFSIFDQMNPALLGAWFPVVFIVSILLFMGLSLWLLPKLFHAIYRKLSPNDDARLTMFLAILLAIVFLGEVIGVSSIVSAFIAGMAIVRVPELNDNHRVLHRKLEGIGYGFFVPMMFLGIGMKTDLSILTNAWSNAIVVAATCAGLIVSKVLSGWIAMRLSGFTHLKGICAGLMTVPQLSATLAAATVALQLNMLSASFFNAIVCLSIVTTLPVPTLVKLLIEKGKIRFDPVDNRTAELVSEVVDDDTI